MTSSVAGRRSSRLGARTPVTTMVSSTVSAAKAGAMDRAAASAAREIRAFI